MYIADDQLKLHAWLSDFLSMIIVALMLSPIIPLIIPIAIAGSYAHCYMNKALILNVTKPTGYSCKRIALKMYE
jgi:hypothetical protein